MNSKSIHAFVRRSIKTYKEEPDIAELHRLLDAMKTDEIQKFWTDFNARRAYSTANTTVPDWKTDERRKCFEKTALSWAFFPKEKDSNGRHVIVRKDLEDHVETHLLRYIRDERLSAQELRDSPLFVRLHIMVGMAFVFLNFAAIPIGICLAVYVWLIHTRTFDVLVTPALYLYTALFALYMLMALVRTIIRK